MKDGNHVKGLDDLLRLMSEFPTRVKKNVMRGALRAGAVLIAEGARQRVPELTGQLKASIRVDSFIRKDGTPMAVIKAGSRDTVYAIAKGGRKTKAEYKSVNAGGKVTYHAAYYAAWVEFGTSKAPSRPFIRPAFDGQKEAAIQAIGDYLEKRLPEEIQKLKGQS